MPELPEVETICRGITPLLVGQKIITINIRQPKLRWPVPKTMQKNLKNAKILTIARRSKYIILATTNGSLIIHLGMSGKLLLLPTNHPPLKHEHVTFSLDNDKTLCFVDPRRFGCILWTKDDPYQHQLLITLGLEPLVKEFNGAYLHKKAQTKKIAIKQFLMDSHIVCGVGNIYANEAMFQAKIHPQTPVNEIALTTFELLAKEIRVVLTKAIQHGGTTLRDYRTSEGKAGNFKIRLQVYGRNKQKCKRCNSIIQHFRQNQRSTYYCPGCQHR